MKTVISSQNIPIKMWLDDMEQGAMDQAKNLANLPFAFRHVPIMPDSHQGYGMPIGAVLATKGVVVPNAVGVDIGCGMCSIKSSITDKNKIDFSKLTNLIQKTVPVGFNHHKHRQNDRWMPEIEIRKNSVVEEQLSAAKYQIGTLGGGNHFIEIQEGDDGFIWIMIHSGSRNIGYKTANFHNEKAKEINRKYWSTVPQSWDLAFIPIDSEEGQNYMADLKYATEFAKMNRYLMMERVKEVLLDCYSDSIYFDKPINKPHNFAELENHFGKNVLIHRKGACRSRLDEIGMIPGSQGSKSYIVRGLGNKESFKSCSHGAGRVMSRSKARKSLNLAQVRSVLNSRGVIHNLEKESQLDEAPQAYKDIDRVMENQKDLVEVLVELKPLLVIKG